MTNKNMIKNKRYVDLSASSRSKLNMYEKILEDKFTVYTPASVLKILSSFVRNETRLCKKPIRRIWQSGIFETPTTRGMSLQT